MTKTSNIISFDTPILHGSALLSRFMTAGEYIGDTPSTNKYTKDRVLDAPAFKGYYIDGTGWTDDRTDTSSVHLDESLYDYFEEQPESTGFGTESIDDLAGDLAKQGLKLLDTVLPEARTVYEIVEAIGDIDTFGNMTKAERLLNKALPKTVLPVYKTIKKELETYAPSIFKDRSSTNKDSDRVQWYLTPTFGLTN